jgi:hypothetical protein
MPWWVGVVWLLGVVTFTVLLAVPLTLHLTRPRKERTERPSVESTDRLTH